MFRSELFITQAPLTSFDREGDSSLQPTYFRMLEDHQLIGDPLPHVVFNAVIFYHLRLICQNTLRASNPSNYRDWSICLFAVQRFQKNGPHSENNGLIFSIAIFTFCVTILLPNQPFEKIFFCVNYSTQKNASGVSGPYGPVYARVYCKTQVWRQMHKHLLSCRGQSMYRSTWLK